MNVLEIPAAECDPTEHADWIELEAIQSRFCSYTEFAAKIHQSATTDAMTPPEDDTDPHDLGGEQSAEVADSAWHEIERRFIACGGAHGYYPFELSDAAITTRDDWHSTAYAFQLLLSHFGHAAGPPGTFGDRLFESLSAQAAKEYFGGDANSVATERFGFPRESRTGFVTALRDLCRRMNSGAVKDTASGIAVQKDSHLDIVVWRPFTDKQESLLIGFGQCATGANWQHEKLTELQPSNFREKWLTDGFYPEPVRLFFIPRTVSNAQWRNTAIDGGIIFDRCRISNLVGCLDGALASGCREWTEFVANDTLSRTV